MELLLNKPVRNTSELQELNYELARIRDDLLKRKRDAKQLLDTKKTKEYMAEEESLACYALQDPLPKISRIKNLHELHFRDAYNSGLEKAKAGQDTREESMRLEEIAESCSMLNMEESEGEEQIKTRQARTRTSGHAGSLLAEYIEKTEDRIMLRDELHSALANKTACSRFNRRFGHSSFYKDCEKAMYIQGIEYATSLERGEMRGQ